MIIMLLILTGENIMSEEKNNLEEEFQVIHTYTREDALNDGYFSDVTTAFNEALGKKLPQNFKAVITPDMRDAISKDAAARGKSEGEALIIFLKSVACSLIDAKKPEHLYTSFQYHFAVESKDGEKIKVEKNYWVADENNGLNIFFPNEY